MLKKITVLAFAIAAVLPAAPAGAWEQVCMKLPLWKTWFSGTFHVVYDFPTTPGGDLPGKYSIRGMSKFSTQRVPGELEGNSDIIASGHIDSPGMHVNQTKCVDIREIPEGNPFIVYFDAHFGIGALCETHQSNPEKWYHQTNRPYRTLNYESTGTTLHVKCKYTHES